MQKSLPKRAFDFLASYAFAVVLLFFMLLLTFFGTLEQVSHGLFEVQKKYFESIWLVHDLHIGPNTTLPLPLPGVYLLMVLLFINMLCGAIIRVRKEWRRPGMLIAHGGIMFLVLSGFVTYHFSTSGHMTLYEGEQADNFDSYYDWMITITEMKEGGKRFTIHGDQFQDMGIEERRVFQSPDLPFDLHLAGFMKNSWPQPAPPVMAMGIDGVMLEPHDLEKEAERNVAGVTVTVLEKTPQPEAHDALLWGLSVMPWKVNVDGADYAIDLAHKEFPVPFTIRLDKFIRDLHPRTSMAANFESEVTKIENASERRIHIKMNEPLRHQGYTFFQASWGPQDARPGDPLFSTFAVVNNPADQWPKYSCYIIALGLMIHFGQKLFSYLRAENRRRPA